MGDENLKLFRKKGGLKRTVVDLQNPKFNWRSDKIVVNTATSQNLLQLSRENKNAYDVYVSLLNHDFILYMHQNEQSFFIKR